MAYITVAMKDASGNPWTLLAAQYSQGITFAHTPDIGGSPGFTTANPGFTSPMLGGQLGFTVGNPGFTSPVINGAPGFTGANPGVIVPFLGSTAGFTPVNPGAVTLMLGGIPALSQVNPGYVIASLSAGTAPIGSVAVTALPALPAGANLIGAIALSIAAGAPGSAGNPLFTQVPGADSGTDTSNTTWSIMGTGGAQVVNTQPLLKLVTVTKPGGYYVQNQSVNPLILAFTNGAGGTPSFMVLDPAISSGRQGASADVIALFVGTIEIFGPIGSQFMAWGA